MSMGSLGGATFTVHTEGVEDMVQRFARMKQELNALAAAQDKAADHMERGARRGAYAFLELTRAIEDAQYGFHGVVNNLPQMLQYMGMGAGMAGVASLAAVAVNQLVQHWDELGDAMQASWLNVAADRLARIREEAEAAAEGFERLSKVPTKAGAAMEKGITEAITEGPTSKVLEAVLAGVKGDESLRAKPSEVPTLMGLGPSEKGLLGLNPQTSAAIRKRLDEEDRKKAAALLHEIRQDTPAGATARETVKAMVRKNPGGFPAGFLGDLENLDPAAQAEQAKLEREGELRGANQRQAQRIAREAEKEHNRRGALLMRDNEAQMAQEARANEKMLRERQREAERLKREQGRRKDAEDRRAQADLNRMLREDIRGPERRRGGRQEGGFVGFAEFAKEIQAGALNSHAERAQKLREEQLKALNDIRQMLAENPALQAVAGAGVLGALAPIGPN